jgi:hypothetical protein
MYSYHVCPERAGPIACTIIFGNILRIYPECDIKECSSESSCFTKFFHPMNLHHKRIVTVVA